MKLQLSILFVLFTYVLGAQSLSIDANGVGTVTTIIKPKKQDKESLDKAIYKAASTYSKTIQAKENGVYPIKTPMGDFKLIISYKSHPQNLFGYTLELDSGGRTGKFVVKHSTNVAEIRTFALSTILMAFGKSALEVQEQLDNL